MNDQTLPRHVAIIMDGNGRWAKQHAVSVALGHRQGVEALRDIIRYSSDSGISVLSIYAFSTENWSRPRPEVAALMRLIEEFFEKEIDELHQKKVCIRILGDKSALPDGALQAVLNAEQVTKDNPGLVLNIAINYGARDEILMACKELARKLKTGEMQEEDLTPAAFEQLLFTAGQPDVDLLIRTSGEQRLSNFLLYQCAYAEMIFPKVLWPDFSLDDYKSALSEFGNRDRRFGGRK